MSPNVAATISPPMKSKRVRLRIRPDPDPDEDQRPQAPQPVDLLLAQVAGALQERDRAGQDQEDAPAKEATSDVHGTTVPDRRTGPHASGATAVC